MYIFESLKAFDTSLFLLLNGLHSGFFDGVMFAFSAKFTWVPFYISILYVVIKQWKSKSVWIITALILCIVISDQVSSGIIKELVQRPRPSHAENLKGLVHLVRDYDGGRFGFVSSHAANTFGFALLSSLIFRRKSYIISTFSWAAIIAYSRIYLGVHYPFDILGGIIVGVSAAIFLFLLLKKYRPNVLNSEKKISDLETIIPEITLGISLIGIIFYSLFLFQ